MYAILYSCPTILIDESVQGHPEASARRLAAIDEIPKLDVNDDVKKLAIALTYEGSLPKKATEDDGKMIRLLQ